MAHIVYTIECPLVARDVDRYGINFLLNRNNKVTVVDVSDITLPMLSHDRREVVSSEDISIHTFQTIGSLHHVKPIFETADLIINFVGISHFTPENLPLHRLVTQSKKPYVFAFTNPYPGWSRYRGEEGMLLDRVLDISRRVGDLKLVNTLMARTPKLLLGVRSADYMIVGGRSCVNYGRLAGRSTHYIRAHAMDYENFRSEEINSPRQTNTAVFIDEYLPYHPDLAHMGVGAPMDPDKYYNCLREFFALVEKICHLEVVIAACPRADYSDKPNIFGNRKIKYNSTARLVAQSRLVIAHRSTAINYAVLFRKPIMLSATQEIYDHNSQTPFLRGFSRALKLPLNFIDDPKTINFDNIFNFDEAVYERYIEDFIKQSGSEEAPLWQIVVDAINSHSSNIKL